MIERLLEAWRETRDPRVEGAIIRVGRAAVRAPLVPRLHPANKRLEAAWHAAAPTTTAADLDRLLDATWTCEPEPMLARVEALARFAPDPRLARKLTAIAPRFPWGAELHRAIAAIVAASITPSIAHTPLLVAQRHYEGWWHEYEGVRRALAACVPKVADPELLAEVAARDLAPLWDAVHAEPANLAHRAVLADALLQVHDPRGELMALQLSGAPAARMRIAGLLKCHYADWLPPFTRILHHLVRFSNGFVSALGVELDGAMLGLLLDRPEWRMIEALRISGHRVDLPALFARMPLLRIVELDQNQLRDDLATGTYPTLGSSTGSRPPASPRFACRAARTFTGAWRPPCRSPTRRSASLSAG